ncbi:hypothetical protein HOP38_02615 [Vibrio mediterranei]|uniref:hypothetical protein n=1 Tax=Vibrio mediterranei TaxID=689 RepID=UPI00181D36E1|nr:hypothetical protein [Vibrio mediterranei]NUW71403.1 hypothetical protein [Vibrio mediterranei]
MKHKHYEMIVAKAANMELVQFRNIDGEWIEKDGDSKGVSFYADYQYYLCLGQYKKECLHWLNGGEVQMRRPGREWLTLEKFERDPKWHTHCGFMKDEYGFRIKPVTKKRWIAVSRNSAQTSPLFNYEKEIKSAYKSESWQHIEIDVEGDYF